MAWAGVLSRTMVGMWVAATAILGATVWVGVGGRGWDWLLVVALVMAALLWIVSGVLAFIEMWRWL